MPAQTNGHWVQRFLVATRDVAESAGVTQRLRTVADALAGARSAAQVDPDTSAAIAELIKALDGVDGAVIQLHSLIVLKFVNENGQRQLTARLMTPTQRLELARRPEVLHDPELLLRLLTTPVAVPLDDGAFIDSRKSER